MVGHREEKRLVKGFNLDADAVMRRVKGSCARATCPARARGTQGAQGYLSRAAERGKRTRNNLESDHEQQPFRSSRAETEGLSLRSAVVTGNNRTAFGARNKMENEQEIQVAQ
jgi:hypothetical protein